MADQSEAWDLPDIADTGQWERRDLTPSSRVPRNIYIIIHNMKIIITKCDVTYNDIITSTIYIYIPYNEYSHPIN